MIPLEVKELSVVTCFYIMIFDMGLETFTNFLLHESCRQINLGGTGGQNEE